MLVELMASRELAVPVAKLLAKVVAAHHAAAADVAQVRHLTCPRPSPPASPVPGGGSDDGSATRSGTRRR